MGSRATEISEAVALEYQALRAEINLRLEIDNHLITHNLVVAGALVTLLVLGQDIVFGGYQNPATVSPYAVNGFLAAFLVGPVICVLLQLQHLRNMWAEVHLGDYIAEVLGVEPLTSTGSPAPAPFQGWEKYWQRRVTATPLAAAFFVFHSGAPYVLPTAVAMFYLASYYSVGQAAATARNVVVSPILRAWLWIDVGLLIVGLLCGVFSLIAIRNRPNRGLKPENTSTGMACVRSMTASTGGGRHSDTDG